jgi:hypothetical protein
VRSNDSAQSWQRGRIAPDETTYMARSTARTVGRTIGMTNTNWVRFVKWGDQTRSSLDSETIDAHREALATFTTPRFTCPFPLGCGGHVVGALPTHQKAPQYHRQGPPTSRHVIRSVMANSHSCHPSRSVPHGRPCSAHSCILGIHVVHPGRLHTAKAGPTADYLAPGCNTLPQRHSASIRRRRTLPRFGAQCIRVNIDPFIYPKQLSSPSTI